MSGSPTSRTESALPGARLQSHSPFANPSGPEFVAGPLSWAPGRGVVASDRDGLAIVRLAARKDRLGPLTSRIRERFRVELPLQPERSEGNPTKRQWRDVGQPRRAAANGVAFVGVGVETWLSIAESGSAGFTASLREAVEDLAAVSDQTSGYAVLRLTGPRVRDALAKFIPVDLHARVFDPGAAASTSASHIPVTLWRLADGADGLPVFEIAAPRSYAGSFWHVVTESAAEFGFVRE
jgi:heterotetrameric sarcosine oxidase gamma subunit